MPRTAPVVALLVLAFGVRAFYARGLLLNFDEANHLSPAQKISLDPAHLHLPLGNEITNHPVGVLYLLALANWIAGGWLFGIRLFFMALSMFGLVGLYLLARSFFGHRAAVIALGLAAVDRYMVGVGPVFLEDSVSINLVPWALLAAARCLDRGRVRDWAVLGLVWGVGWNLYQLFGFLPMALLAYLLVSRRIVAVARQPGAYLAAGLFVLLLVPNLWWNLTHETPNLSYIISKSAGVGLTPRFLLQYIWDLLILAKEPVWIAFFAGSKVHLPMSVPTHWAAGLAYLGCLLYALWHWRRGGHGLLLAAVLVPAVVVTVVAPGEPFDSFWWSCYTIVPVFCLAGWAAEAALRRRAGRAAVLAGLAGAAVLLGVFLDGPEWGYFCPQWERAYVGKVVALGTKSSWNPARFPEAESAGRIRALTDRAIAEHPGSAIAWYFRGRYAPGKAERAAAFDRALALRPDHPLVLRELAADRIQARQWAAARELLGPLIAAGYSDPEVHWLLAWAEHRLGRLPEARNWARQALAARPEEFRMVKLLFLIRQAMGERRQAGSLLEAFVSRHPGEAARVYADVAWELHLGAEPQEAREYAQRAAGAGPDGDSAGRYLSMAKVEALIASGDWAGAKMALERLCADGPGRDAVSRYLSPDYQVAKFADPKTWDKRALTDPLAAAQVFELLMAAHYAAGRGEHVKAYLKAYAATRPEEAGRIYLDVGRRLHAAGDAAAAEDYMRLALGVDPGNPDAQHYLGVRLAQRGKVPEAMDRFRKVLRTSPDHRGCLNDLAWLLATSGDAGLRDPQEAVRLAVRLATLGSFGDATALDVLAAAYASAGKFDEAAATAQSALGLALAAGDAALARNIRARLDLYKSGKPFHAGP